MQILPTQQSQLLGYIPTEFFAPVQNATAGVSFSDLLAVHSSDPMNQTPAASSLATTAGGDLPAAADTQRAADTLAMATPPAAIMAVPPAAPQMAAKPGEAPGLEAMSQVKMTQEDFSQVRGKLEQAGVPKETLDDMEKRVASPQGYTWGQFVQGLQQSVHDQLMPKVELSAADKANLSSLFGRLGFDTKQAGELAEGLANGQTGKVWKQIATKLASMDPSTTASIPPEEAQALFKGLRLPDAAQGRLTALFGQLSGKELNADALKSAFQAVKAESDAQSNQIHDALKQLRTAVEPVMAQAQNRVLTARQAMEGLVDAQGTKVSSMLKEPAQAVANAQEAATSQKTQPAQPAQSGHSSQPDQAGAHAVDPNAKNGQHDPGTSQNSGKNGQEQQTGQEKAWNEFWGKVRVEGDAVPHPNAQTPDAAFAALAGKATSTAAAVQGKAGDAGMPRTPSQQFLDQVESGIVRNLGQGTRQMTLELTPDNLGKLNVVLTVKGKEIQAIVKAESPEAGKLLGDNIQQLKDSLERQGLTVSKLVVQTGLTQDSNLGQQWAGANQHNLAQERRDALERMRGSGSTPGGISGLAQDVQNTGAQVKISQGGLDVIA